MGQVEQLIEQLKLKNPLNPTDDVTERNAAAIKLGKLGDHRAVDPLINALKDNLVCWEAAYALGKLGDIRAIEPLVIMAQTWANPSHRCIALTALGELADRSAAEEIRNCLVDNSGDVRQEAAYTLSLLEEPQWQKWVRGAEADLSHLGECGDPLAIVPLIRAIGMGKESSMIAVKGLAKLGEPKWAGMIKGELKDFQRLAMGGDPRAIIPLSTAMKLAPQSFTRLAATKALCEMHDPRAIEHFTWALSDPDTVVRQMAAFGLQNIVSPHAFKPLIRALGDKDEKVRALAIKGLAILRDPRSVEPISKLENDGSEMVRKMVTLALAQLRKTSVVKQP